MPLVITRTVALLALSFAMGAFALRWRAAQRRPLAAEPFLPRNGIRRAAPGGAAADRAPAKGSPQRGLLYAFTLGMAPWAKESTRLHQLAYLRGIVFHGGIFTALAALLLSPIWSLLPKLLLYALAGAAAIGALCGVLGALARWFEPNLRALSTPDDFASVLLVALFQGLTGIALLNPAWLPALYLSAALMLVYAPLGKIRHCIYFFFSRRFFGLFLGRRGLVQTEAGP
ncbi:MAG TPA: hypothetical protein VJ123_01780 [Anaerolineales bacterium]|nr:hypothetical protein [Anaerolineales bacterium]